MPYAVKQVLPIIASASSRIAALILFGPNLPFCHSDAHKKQILLK